METQITGRIKNGSRPCRLDHRDYDLHRSFGSVTMPTFVDEYFANAGLTSELYSILGNFNAIRTGEDSPEFDAVAYIISSIKSVLKAFIKD